MSLAELEHQLRIKDAVRPRLNPYIGYFVFMLFIVFVLRIQTNVPKPNVTFDEAFNVTRGVEILNGDFSRSINLLERGSFLFPAVSGLVYSLAGQDGLTAMAAGFGAVAAMFIFGAARVLFGATSGLYGMVLFGILGASVNLGQLNLHQSMALPLLAMAFYFTVDSATIQGRPGYVRVILAGVCTGLAVLTAYVSVFYLPLLIIALALIHYYQEWPIPHALSLYLMIVLMIVGGYVLLNYQLLAQFIALNIAPAIDLSAERSKILADLFAEFAFVWILGAAGAVLFVVQLRRMQVMSNRALIAVVLFAPVLVVLALAAPFYQFFVGSIQNLWQNALLSLVFIIPFAGFSVAMLHDTLHHARRSLELRAVSFVVVLAVAFWFANYGLERNFGFVTSIPDVNTAIDYVKSRQPTRETRILAEQAAIYEFYYDLGADDAEVWTNTFFMQYKGLEGVEAMVQAISERYFDIVILDDYFTADTVNPLLEDALAQAGYRRIIAEPEPQLLSSGQEILVRIYASPER